MSPRIIAHRGWSAKAPENTMAAFRLAIELGADGLELDVHLTRDGHAVICHDERLDRTTDGTGLIAELTLDEIRRFDAGSWFGPQYRGERVPTLRELLEAIAESTWQGIINIELKTGIIRYPGIEEAVVRLLREFDLASRAIISSFNHYSLAEVRRIAQDVETGILYSAGLYEPWAYAARIGCRALHPLHFAAVPEIIEGAHAHGFEVNVWTVDDPIRAKALAAAGVDGIITNQPDVIRQALSGGAA